MKNQNRTSSKGFSLVELIVVIAIMAILVGILAPSLLNQLDKAKLSKDKQLLDTVRSAVETAMADPDSGYDTATTLKAGTSTTLAKIVGATDASNKQFASSVKMNLKNDVKAAFTSKSFKGKTISDAVIEVDKYDNLKVTIKANTGYTDYSIGNLQ